MRATSSPRVATPTFSKIALRPSWVVPDEHVQPRGLDQHVIQVCRKPCAFHPWNLGCLPAQRLLTDTSRGAME
jgi:hypothetical protein